MSDLEQLTKFFMQENAKASVERMALKQILITLIARHAKEYERPEEYIMSLTAASLSSFDETPPEDDLGRMAFEHGASYCNQIETGALSQLQND